MATTAITQNARRGWTRGDLDYRDTHNFALYQNSTHGPQTPAYTPFAEVTGPGYVAKGKFAGSGLQLLDVGANVVFLDYNDTSWADSTITATDCMLYDEDSTSPATDVAIYIGDFGGSFSTSTGLFTIEVPIANATSALIRLA